MDIIIEGNIGIGKTTYLDLLGEFPDESIELKKEPVDVWIQLGLLDTFYKDPVRWAYTFQSVAFPTRLSIAAAPRENPKGVRILERSVFADKICFAAAQYEVGNINEMEWNAYCLWYKIMMDKFPEVQAYDKIIYLRATPEACIRRIKERSRDAEVDIDIGYLRLLHSKYEKWLTSPEMSNRVHIIDVEKDWESKESYRQIVYAEIRKIIAEVRSH
jgi:deoxyadenosine/deoxycytidine kinase